MLKRLATFGLAFLVFSVQAHVQTRKTQEASQGNKSAFSAPTATVPENGSRPNLQAEHDKHVEADVRIISSPTKDRYDKAAFWISVVLAVVGVMGVIAAVRTLSLINAQVAEMRRQRVVMQRTLASIRRQANHMAEQTSILRDSVAAANTRAKAANDNIDLVINGQRAHIRIEIDDLDFSHSRSLGDRVTYRVIFMGLR
jgi:DNA-binding protein YbaB